MDGKPKFFAATDELSQNQAFSLKKVEATNGQKGGYYFIHRSGRRVETDAEGAWLWGSLPQKAGELSERLTAFLRQSEAPPLNHQDKIFISKNRVSFRQGGLLADNVYKDEKKPADCQESQKPQEKPLSSMAEVYLYVLYRAGIILCNGKSAIENNEGEENESLKKNSDVTPSGLPVKSRELERAEGESLGSLDKYLGNKSRPEWPLPLPLVSVVVVTYNGEKFIRPCLSSIRRQSWPNCEVIVVDNASSDRTAAIIRAEFPEVRFYSFRKNRHFARAVNFGIKMAGGDSSLILNQDVELHKNCIANLKFKLLEEEREKVAAVVPLLKFFDLRGFVNGLGNHIRPWGWGSDNFIGAVDVGQFEDFKAVPSACFGAVLLRRQALDQVGLLDEAYGSFYEDSDWSFRAWLGGWRIIPCPKAVVYHHFGGSYETERKLRFVVRNRLRLVLKIFSGRKRLGFLRRYLTEDCRVMLSLLGKKEWSLFLAYLRAYFSLGLNFPGIWLKRRQFKKRQIKGKTEADVLALNPEPWSFLNEQNEPVVNLALVINYYLKCLEINNLNSGND